MKTIWITGGSTGIGFATAKYFLKNNWNVIISSSNIEKLTNSIKSVEFNQLKQMEKEKGFNEKSKKANMFFRKGETKEWKKSLNIDLTNKINNNFKKEMTYLNYI